MKPINENLSLWIPNSNYLALKIIGQGALGIIALGIHKKTN